MKKKFTIDIDVQPDLDRARSYVCDDWEVDSEEVARGFERIEEATQQTGLDRWT